MGERKAARFLRPEAPVTPFCEQERGGDNLTADGQVESCACRHINLLMEALSQCHSRQNSEW